VLGPAPTCMGARGPASSGDRLYHLVQSSIISLHGTLTMAPHAGFDTDHIKDKARKDLLYLLEGVSKGPPMRIACHAPADHCWLGSRQEESSD